MIEIGHLPKLSVSCRRHKTRKIISQISAIENMIQPLLNTALNQIVKKTSQKYRDSRDDAISEMSRETRISYYFKEDSKDSLQ